MSTGAVRSKRAPRWVLGHRVTPLETLGDYAMLRITTDPSVPGPPPHHHDDASEFFLVLDGQLEVLADGEWTLLEAGDTFCIPENTVHTFRNPGDRPTDWITAFSPRGFEAFFLDFGVPCDEPGSADRSVSAEMIGRVVAECGRYGMILAEGP